MSELTPPPAGSAADVPKESARTILFQFVVFPLGVVLIGVAIFLLFGMLASERHTAPDYLNEIQSGSSHERWQAAYQLSRSIERGEAKKYPNLAPDVGRLYTASKNDDPRIRRYLSMVLGKLGDRRATPLLVEGLKDQDVDNHVYALLALGELGDPHAVPALLPELKSSEKDVRKTAAYALGQLGDPSSVPALAAAMSDPVADVRFNTALALARFNDPRALPGLHEMLDRSHLDKLPGMRDDQKEDAMIVAMGPYEKLAGREALPDLQKLAQSDKSLRVRAAAAEAVRRVK
jgi:HEAT repeat protein